MPNLRTLNALGASMMLFLTSLAAPASAAAQERVSGFAVVARVDSVQLRSDTVRLVYVVHNSAGSSFSLTGLIVPLLAAGTLLEEPARELWSTTRFQLDGDSAAMWEGLGEAKTALMAPHGDAVARRAPQGGAVRSRPMSEVHAACAQFAP
jgi:hypothetical protein